MTKTPRPLHSTRQRIAVLPACFTCRGTCGSTRNGQFYICSDCGGTGTVAK